MNLSETAATLDVIDRLSVTEFDDVVNRTDVGNYADLDTSSTADFLNVTNFLNVTDFSKVTDFHNVTDFLSDTDFLNVTNTLNVSSVSSTFMDVGTTSTNVISTFLNENITHDNITIVSDLSTMSWIVTSTLSTSLVSSQQVQYYSNTSEDLLNLSNSSELQPHLAHHPSLAILLTMFVFVTIFGNCLVMVAIAKERYLRSVTNYLIVSLAVADLLVGTIVMPFSIAQTMMGGYWPFGHDWCDLWHSFDVLGSTASILNLCVIALDRYWAITDPIAYPTRMSNKRVWILICLVWVCSSAISFPAIIWWRLNQPDFYPANECWFTENSSYLIISSIVSFYTPLFIMLFVYYRIYRAATARSRSMKSGGNIVLSDGLRGEMMTLRIHRGRANPPMIRNGHDQGTYHRPQFTDTETDSGSHVTHTGTDSEDDPKPHTRFIKRRIQRFAIGRKLSRLAKEQKAAKTLGIVIGVFVICWVPFFLTNALIGICHKTCVAYPDIYMPVFTWLGYLNSGMNPIIYALSMRDFRRAFKRLLCIWCPKIKTIPKLPPKRTHQRSMSTTSFSVAGNTTASRDPLPVAM